VCRNVLMSNNNNNERNNNNNNNVMSMSIMCVCVCVCIILLYMFCWIGCRVGRRMVGFGLKGGRPGGGVWLSITATK
jgi:hypothetical protein